MNPIKFDDKKVARHLAQWRKDIEANGGIHAPWKGTFTVKIYGKPRNAFSRAVWKLAPALMFKLTKPIRVQRVSGTTLHHYTICRQEEGE